MSNWMAEITDVFFNKRAAPQDGRTEQEVRTETLKEIVLRSPCTIRVGKKRYRVTAEEIRSNG